jgi:hypothetical protein
MNRRLFAVALAAGLVCLLAGCARTTQLGPVITESQSIELGKAKSVGVNIELGAGRLVLSGSDSGLLQAQFQRNTGLSRPELSYTVAGDRGTLTLRQPDQEHTPGNIVSTRAYRYEWDLQLNRTVPIDLSIELGAGTVDLGLAGLSLNTVTVNYGAASGRIDLDGPWTHDLDVTVKGGVGSASIRLPEKVGAEVEVEGGIGAVDAYDFTRQGNAYVNKAYGTTPETLRVHLEAGIGAVNLEQGTRG